MEPSTGSDLPLFVSSSTGSRPQFDHRARSIDPVLFQSPPHKRPENARHDCSDDGSDGLSFAGTSSMVGYTSTPPTSSPAPLSSILEKVLQEVPGSKQAARSKRATSTPPTSSRVPLNSVLQKVMQEAHGSQQAARSKRAEEGQFLMNQRFRPYKRRQAPPPLELRFAMRSLGRSSFTDLGFEDVVEGKDIFERGLSTLSPNVIRQAYRAKLATKQCVLSRLSTTLLELDAAEKHSDFLRAVKKEHEKELSVISKELQSVKDVVVGQGIDIDDHIAFSHAVYAEELVALTMADLQLHQLSMVQGRQMPFASDSDGTTTSDCETTPNSSEDEADLDRYDDVKYDQ